MRMTVTPETLRANRVTLTLDHAGETQTWSVAPFNKKVFVEDLDVTEHINKFWMSRPLARQQQIFEIYKQIYAVLSNFGTAVSLLVDLRPLVKQLYDCHPLEEIDQWIAFHGSDTIHIPVRLEDTFVHSDERPMTRDKTYTKPDYVKLIGLTLALRPMIPIWGEFIERTHKETGTSFKEYYAYLLLAYTKLNESQAMEKLLVFIRSYQAGVDQSKNPTAIVDGLGTETSDEWLLGALLVTRICVGDIRGSDTAPGLVITSYKYITGRISGSMSASGGNFGDVIRAKDFKTSGTDDQEISMMEAYKVKQLLPIGAIAPFEHDLNKPYDVARKVYPQVDLILLDKMIAAIAHRQTDAIWPPQITLTKIMLARAMSPQAIEHVDKPHTLVAMAIAQTVLWQKGHRKLAGLLSAVSTTNSNSHTYSGTGVMARIPREMAEEIGVLYPYSFQSVTRQKTTPPCEAIVAIDKIAEQFNARDWILMLPEALGTELLGSNARRYPCPHDIKIQLARLTIETAKRL